MLHFNKKIFTTVLVDFLPIFVFIIFFELFNFFEATVAIIVATVISFIVAILKEKRVPVFMFITATLTFVFGYATLLYDSSNILKLKDTFFDFAAGTILLFGLVVFKRIIVKDFFKHVFSYTDHGWKVLTYFWVAYFYIGGILNEIIRHIKGPRGDEIWVYYKIAHIPVTIIFAIIFIYFANKKYKLETEDKNILLK